MAKVILRQEAVNDLNEIWLYTFYSWSEKQADNYYESLENACMQIGVNPMLGKKYPTINPDLLGFKSGRHIIFYQILNKNEVDVIRILHEQIDIESKLGNEDY